MGKPHNITTNLINLLIIPLGITLCTLLESGIPNELLVQTANAAGKQRHCRYPNAFDSSQCDGTAGIAWHTATAKQCGHDKTAGSK